MTKANRLLLIENLIENNIINTQQELQLILKNHNVEVTQATVSRDMKELRLSKTMRDDGVYCYVVPPKTLPDDLAVKFKTIFRESVLSFTGCGNILIIKCYSGMGNAACEALDALGFSEILGSLAGDNTIFAVVQSEEQCLQLIARLNKILSV